MIYRFITIVLLLIIQCYNIFADKDTIIAVVDKTPITFTELKKFMNIREFLNQKKENDNEALNALIEKTILLQEASKYVISVQDTDIEKAIENLVESTKTTSINEFFRLAQKQYITKNDIFQFLKSEILKDRFLLSLLRSEISITADEINTTLLQRNIKDTIVEYQSFSIDKSTRKSAQTLEHYSQKVHPCQDKVVTPAPINYTKTTENISQLPTVIRSMVQNLMIKEKTTVVEMDDQLKFFILCDKIPPKLTREENQYMYDILLDQKLVLNAKEYIHKIKKTKNIWLNLDDNYLTIN